MNRIRDRYYSLRYRLAGRCWTCNRRMIRHGPWRLARCWAENRPSAIVLPETLGETLQRIARKIEADPDSVVPVSHAEPRVMGKVQ